ncbi:efflux RND transporter periplasmic adaptor subunit [Aurantimonas marina]|uniref:efflux RND transporter periplasmic adaptor subunit n=1 Tax=Aurantimonas marina TaxID=2780508 RepID=UPI0019D18049|nr:hypothetical protein [Aurantimonas marina]
MTTSTFAKRLFPILLALAAGAAVIAYMVSARTPPGRRTEEAPARAVRVIEARPLPVTLTVRGFGAARPARVWQAVATVNGPITFRNSDLENGNILPAGTRLLQIDPTRYGLAIAATEADVAALETERRQLEQERSNTSDLMALEQRRLDLAEQELERARSLVASGTSPRARLDDQERATVQQRVAVQTLENRLRLIPSQIDHVDAQQARARTALAQARRDLEDTEIIAPFDLRIGTVDVELEQQVTPGQRLVTGDGIDKAEAAVHIRLSELRRLLATQSRATPSAPLDLGAHFDLSAISAEVRLVAASGEMSWPGRLERVESEIDPATRTVRAIVSVDEPYRAARPPELLPLVRGMYVEAILSSLARTPAIVIPVSAVHQDVAYLADKDDRLRLVPIRSDYSVRDVAVIAEGLQPGDRVIVDDVVPAIEGMRLRPRRDPVAEAALVRAAMAEDVP